MDEQKSVTPEEMAKLQQQQGTQIQIGGGLIPLPNGTFIGHIWFSNLPNEATARQFMAQVDNTIKQMFTPQQPPQHTNGPEVKGPT